MADHKALRKMLVRDLGEEKGNLVADVVAAYQKYGEADGIMWSAERCCRVAARARTAADETVEAIASRLATHLTRAARKATHDATAALTDCMQRLKDL